MQVSLPMGTYRSCCINNRCVKWLLLSGVDPEIEERGGRGGGGMCGIHKSGGLCMYSTQCCRESGGMFPQENFEM